MEITPPSGPPGTTINVSGSGCSPDARPGPTEESAEVAFVEDPPDVVFPGFGPTLSDPVRAPVAPDGNWEVQIVVPDVPLDTQIYIKALCVGDTTFTVGSDSFGVETPVLPSTTTTTPTSTPPPTGGPSPAPPATPAQGVQPTFTG
jgi:hypothetical protein